MFYEGDLQSGIAVALQQNKSVVCFICDDGEESKAWEKDVFGDEEVTSTASSSAIVFRMLAGSQEAEYLKAFCPVANPPTVVVIRNGQVKDTFVAGTAQDEIRQRLIGGLSESVVPERPQPTTTEPPTSEAEAPPPAQAVAAAAPASASPTQSSTPHAVEEAMPKPADKPQTSARQEQLERQRKEKQKEKEYKAQVLARIKSDQEERRKRAQQHKPDTPATTTTTTTTTTTSTRRAERTPSQVRLQIRLLNGTPIRNTFTPTQTISHDVRPWLEAEYPEARSTPYNLKVILTPLPSRQVSVAEEEKPLGEVDLGGSSSASLVMTPVRTYSESYTQGSSNSWTGLPGRGVAAGLGLLSSAVGGVASGVGRMLGIGRYPDAPGVIGGRAEGEEEEDSRLRQRESRIRTLERRDENEFYNGNSLDFEYGEDKK